jgi:hypothetical protein
LMDISRRAPYTICRSLKCQMSSIRLRVVTKDRNGTTCIFRDINVTHSIH